MLTYDIKKTEEVMRHFHTVTKIKIVLYNSDFSTIAAVPFEECSFCRAMNDVPQAHKKCRECTINALQLCSKNKESTIYKCHAGLIEAVVPVRKDDITVGYIMLGQVLEEGTDQQEIISYSTPYIGNDAEKLLKELKTRSTEEIYAATKLMESCVCYLLMNKFVHEENGSALIEICEYIKENPTADLSVNALCERFKISRNQLYKLSNTYLGMSVAAYVRTKRLQYAEELIKNGYSVTEAAELSGFYDYGYFGKIFKRYIGKTPSKAKGKNYEVYN